MQNTIKQAFSPELKSTNDSIKKLRKKIQEDLKNENWLGLAETARTLHERVSRQQELTDIRDRIIFQVTLDKRKESTK